ncbi:hypothetical protein DyAD56_15995 [Dyella sp. AD56]|uniref:hypothetical protein n=1 Tax=Dyella sp. AD56 TaxID=1528744 RepID=UPI000C8470DA|nr:hypothetical protein [Dyella sp. AD56]PMQ04190.1 hypothetical protein DyAD56_15995 [Dyella sp. AD56]
MNEEQLENAFSHMMGRVVAMEFALKVLISTHPDPEKLAAVWRARVPDLVDAGSESPETVHDPEFREGLTRQLQLLGSHLSQK